MKTKQTTAKAFALSVLAFAGLLLPAAVAGSTAKPVKIYLLSGQSNMTGRATSGDLNKPAAEQKATLVRYIMEPQNVEKYKFLKETGYEIVGFFWNQGEHDCTPEFSVEYEQNLANLIQDLRKEFNAPSMKVVIATTRFGGRDPKDAKTGAAPKGFEDQLKVIAAQLAVPARPEFKGAVATVETRDFWRSQEQFGGNNQGIHLKGNGESYWLMGEAMGRSMVELNNAQKK